MPEIKQEVGGKKEYPEVEINLLLMIGEHCKEKDRLGGNRVVVGLTLSLDVAFVFV